MALGWMTALKLVPWSDVIEATPKIVKGAKKLFSSTRGGTQHGAQHADGRGPVWADDPKSIASLARILEARVQALEEEQQASAELIASLAEQNAGIVRAVDALQKRVRLLGAACFLSLAGLALVVAWAAQH